jgi:hypothetical protein
MIMTIYVSDDCEWWLWLWTMYECEWLLWMMTENDDCEWCMWMINVNDDWLPMVTMNDDCELWPRSTMTASDDCRTVWLNDDWMVTVNDDYEWRLWACLFVCLFEPWPRMTVNDWMLMSHCMFDVKLFTISLFVIRLPILFVTPRSLPAYDTCC